MCGIAGLLKSAGVAASDVLAVERMTEAQTHRGPSASGIHHHNQIVLGHRRLSIIDVSSSGDQPMTNEDRSLWLTYNGELYNHPELRAELVLRGHRFRSQSDTEVVLHGYEEWGVDGLVTRLRGMYTFGLWDPKLGLLLVRDRLGIKPLYYAAGRDGAVVFASEVRALVAGGLVPVDRDMDAVTGFLLSGSVPAPRTIVKSISSLLPGHYMVCRPDGVQVTRKYLDLPQTPLDEHDSRETCGADEMRALLQDSVARHLVSDVPIGVFLSSGVDSGAILALASAAVNAGGSTPVDRPLTTLTVTFDDEALNEGDRTREIAGRFHTDHREIRVTRTEFDSELPNILAAMDQPTNDGVNTYFVSKAARQAGLTVVLSGLGGDEVFWGYKHYPWLEGRGRRLTSVPGPARRALSKGAAAWGRASGQDNWMRMAFLEDHASTKELYLLMRGFFAPAHVKNLLEIDSQRLSAAVEQQFEGLASEATAGGAHGFNYIEFKRYLHDQLLRDTDVFGMAHSIEVRVPLLDHPIVERVMALGAASKLPNGVNKPLLVHAINDPSLVAAGTASKRGFSLPMDRWMKASAPALEAMAVAGTVLNPRAVGDLWKAFRGDRLHWSRAWALSVIGATVH